jgi:hypothetical protein
MITRVRARDFKSQFVYELEIAGAPVEITPFRERRRYVRRMARPTVESFALVFLGSRRFKPQKSNESLG